MADGVRPAEDRFWSKVAFIPFHTCWEWIGAVGARGYGNFSAHGKSVRAHRFSWELHNGSIPKSTTYHGTVVMHKCDNKRCVNPDHLQLGTQSDNIRDCYSKGRSTMNVLNQRAKQRTHCKKGHEYTPENTSVSPGYRWCKTCSRIKSAKQRAQLKASCK